jgi:hypothetical protein
VIELVFAWYRWKRRLTRPEAVPRDHRTGASSTSCFGEVLLADDCDGGIRGPMVFRGTPSLRTVKQEAIEALEAALVAVGLAPTQPHPDSRGAGDCLMASITPRDRTG